MDVFARWIGGIGAITGVAGLAISYFGWDRRGLWRRRHASIRLIQVSLEELDSAVDPGASPQAMLSLWGIQVQTALDDLAAHRGAIPYRRFRSELKVLNDELVTVRGTQPPTREQEISGDGVVLTTQQRSALGRARACLDRLKALEQKASQKGVV
ncbi:hypothetical protein ACK8HX_02260 [Oryzobacter sp. R7]|uniref:hypothetical protein n=1 Tax=Oryzobacter faecalis TaxID=3388656 RepID=UPI00398D6392